MKSAHLALGTPAALRPECGFQPASVKTGGHAGPLLRWIARVARSGLKAALRTGKPKCRRSVGQLPVALVTGLGGLVTIIDTSAAQPWAASESPRNYWSSIASSADGTTLIAGSGPNPYTLNVPLYVSTNSGATWTQTTSPSNAWASVTCSADGTRMAAVATYRVFGTPATTDNTGVFVSQNSGHGWTRASAPTNRWTSIVSSSDGTRLFAAALFRGEPDPGSWDFRTVGDGQIYRSLDAGETWTRTRAPTNNWTCLASSADGTRLVAAAGPIANWGLDDLTPALAGGARRVYTSSDSGETWNPTSAPSLPWASIGSSADGTRLMAVARNYPDLDADLEATICISRDAGMTWALAPPPGADRYTKAAVSSSADGSRWVVGTDKVYSTADLGVSWTSLGGESTGALSVSADGYRVQAAAWWAPICSLPYSGPWRLIDRVGVGISARGIRLLPDGTTWIAFEDFGEVRLSTNSGGTWTQTPDAKPPPQALILDRCAGRASMGRDEWGRREDLLHDQRRGYLERMRRTATWLDLDCLLRRRNQPRRSGGGSLAMGWQCRSTVESRGPLSIPGLGKDMETGGGSHEQLARGHLLSGWCPVGRHQR